MDLRETWFYRAAFDILIAEGGVDDWEEMSTEELTRTLREGLLDHLPSIIEAANALRNWGT